MDDDPEAASSGRGAGAESLIDALLAPLAEVRATYARAQAALASLTGGLDTLAEAVTVSLAAPGDRPGPTEPPAPAAEPPSARAEVTLDVSADDLERVLNFQEALALVEGVTNITLIGAPEGRAHLVVELGEVAKAAVDPTIVCAWCGRLIAEGGAQVSHGLCPDCAARVFEQRPPER